MRTLPRAAMPRRRPPGLIVPRRPANIIGQQQFAAEFKRRAHAKGVCGRVADNRVTSPASIMEANS
jgi:hypothetical protein